MKRKGLSFLLVIFLTACAQAPATQAPVYTPTGIEQPTQISHTPAVAAPTQQATTQSPSTPTPASAQMPEKFLPLRDEIATRYGVPVDQVVLNHYEDVEWRDSCLGIEQPGMACLDVITPGYIVFFDTPQGEVEVHTNADATSFQIAASQSGIQGQTWISPACPGPVKLGNECPDKPYKGSLWILDKDGSIFAEVTTKEDGSFEVTLPPGTYTITLPKGTAIPALAPQDVTVSSGQFTQIELILDSGLR